MMHTLPLILGGLVAVGLGFGIYTMAAFRPAASESSAAMPGDSLIPGAMATITQALTIDAPPERVWPWIAQMGAGRGGWYSYDIVDNRGRPSASAILPEFQHVAVGDLMPALPGATDGFIVLAAIPPGDLVLGGPPGAEGGQRATWEFLLHPLENNRTRLIVRVRVADHWIAAAEPPAPEKPKLPIERVYGVLAHLPKPLLVAVAGFGHRVMQNQQLRGLRSRALAVAA